MFISKAVGIDLGTTNSAVAVMNPTDTDIIIHRDARIRRETTPSCVWKDPESGQIVVGTKALLRLGTGPPPIRSIKRRMGQQTKVLLTDTEVTPEEVSAMILLEMKRQIEEDLQALSTPQLQWLVDRAIITVPAYFDHPQIEATRIAGEKAGLQVIDLLHEPTAAACYYCWRSGTRDGIFLVYDFGGGTFDVSILRATAGTFEVLGVSGNNFLGGDDLDKALAADILLRLQEEGYVLDLNPQHDQEDLLRVTILQRLAEGVKIGLSSTGDFILRNSTDLRDKNGAPVLIELMYDRPEVETIFRPLVERTIPYCFEALEQAEARAGVRLDHVDAIILAGGSTHIPLVREMVRQNLCRDPEALDLVVDPRAAQPRARCSQPIYERVDTLVALGAAIRAAAVGGLAVYNPGRTVRVSFRGTGATANRTTNIGGQVEALDPALDLADGRISLAIEDLAYEDEQDLTLGGGFAFREVPLQPGAENRLAFRVYDRQGNLVASAGRPISQGQEGGKPTGGTDGTNVLNKAVFLEVETAGGRVVRKELFPALTTLPNNQTYTFSHPGNTELVRLPLYQLKRKIKEITVPVDSSLPKGTLVELQVNIDELSFITIKGKIGESLFDVSVEPPPPRPLPTGAEIEALERTFQETLAYLPVGRRSVAEARYRRAKQSFAAAKQRGDEEQAIHDFEEMEELAAEIARSSAPLQPPREFFDNLVQECSQINRDVARMLAEEGEPYDHPELQRSIDAQREFGIRAFLAGNQRSYSDAITMLENIRNHILALAQRVMRLRDTRTDTERAVDHVQYGQREADTISSLAAAQEKQDLVREADDIKRELEILAGEAQRNPRAVQEKVSQLRHRLQQMKNFILGRSQEDGEGRRLQDYSLE